MASHSCLASWGEGSRRWLKKVLRADLSGLVPVESSGISRTSLPRYWLIFCLSCLRYFDSYDYNRHGLDRLGVSLVRPLDSTTAQVQLDRIVARDRKHPLR